MKKKALIGIIITIILVTICAAFCLRKSGNNKEEPSTETGEVLITITTSNITTETEEITFTITNTTANFFAFGKPFSLERKQNDSWIALTGIGNEPVKDIAYLIKNDGKNHEETLPLKEWYGILSAGEYRIGVGAGDKQTYYGYFTVTEAE